VRRVHPIILGGLIHRNGRGQNLGRAAGLPVGTIPASLPPSLALTQPPPGTRGGDGAGCGPLPSPRGRFSRAAVSFHQAPLHGRRSGAPFGFTVLIDGDGTGDENLN